MGIRMGHRTGRIMLYTTYGSLAVASGYMAFKAMNGVPPETLDQSTNDTKLIKATDDIASVVGLQTYEEMKQQIAEKRKRGRAMSERGDLPHPETTYTVSIKSNKTL